MRPFGVSNHVSRIAITNRALGGDADFEAMIDDLERSLESALREVMTCEPDQVVLGMSAETFWRGATARNGCWTGYRRWRAAR